MYALILRIEFFEAHFKIHYTKGFRLTYPIPLPTSVAGIFGALLGIKRYEIQDTFKDFFFGAKALSSTQDSYENATFIQIPWNKGTWPPGVAPLQILHNPAYRIAIGHREKEELAVIYEQVKSGLKYLPYGGQNDYFLKDLEIGGIYNVEFTTEVENYSCKIDVKKTLTKYEQSTIQILPVMYKKSTEQFYFGYNTILQLKESVPVVDNIRLYELSEFFYPVQ